MDEVSCNLAQYVVENDNQIKVFLNPAAIIAAVNNAGRAVDVQAVIQQTIQCCILCW